MSISAYKQTAKKMEDPRRIEKRVFMQVTSKLERFKGIKDPFGITEEMKDALWENQRLWNILKSDLLFTGNNLPTELRASLASLGIWVDEHTVKVLKAEATVDSLVEVNKTIIGGISGEVMKNAS